MPAATTTNDQSTTTNGGSGVAQLDHILTTFTTLTDPLAINDALLVIEYSLQGPQATAQTTQKVLSSIPLGYFFTVLQQDYGYDTEQTIDRTCHILELLLKDQAYSTLIQDEFMVVALSQALDSPSPRVRALGLSQVDKISEEDLPVLRTLLMSPVFKAVVGGIGSGSISIAERSKKTLLKLCDTQERLEAVINNTEAFTQIKDLTNSRDSIVQLRMIEALTELASKSSETTALLETKSLLDSLKSGLTSTDILTRFNILEILAEFGTTLSGSEFLDHSGVLARIGQVVENEASQDSLGLNAIVKLYGKLGAAEQVDFVSLDMKYQILGQLERLLVGDDEYEPDESSKVEVMSAIGLIGGNVQNVEWVSQSQCSEEFIVALQSLPRDARVAWYHSLAQILACSPDPSQETERIISEFYTRLDGDSHLQSPFVTRLLTSAKSQSQELAMSALSVMIPLAHYAFGVQKLATQRDVLTFLMDRNAEQSHSEKVAKHEVIVAMLTTAEEAKSSSGADLLTADQVSRLDLHRRQGPFYQRATATVSIQDITA
ncbi:26S proteasome non-ATPase regulatory subunit 5 [Linnemannia gamsii]|uniref:26S proteasome non-ATPase regulatory subunit 5 n=1 Tax=Linnemannia gamsii TaxID=64522 RepID=A0ABQ7JVI2_9FUNG|nr:26S proteasome non-ATPase regulatory subunit 5 [Linnemannia gamsii]